MTEITPSVPPPSLQDIEREDDGLDEDQKKRDELERSFWTKLWQGLSIASGVLAIAAMAIEGSAVCIVAGIVAIAVAGAVFKYQWDLEDTDTLRKVQNLLRQDVNRLQQENNVLDSEITKLGSTVESLKGNEEKLQAIATAQGENVSSLVSLVKENGVLVSEMDQATRAATLQSLMDVVLRSDTDQSFTIGTNEVDMLLLRFKVDPRVTVNEGKFRDKVAAAGGELMLSAVVQDLVSPEGPTEEHIFVIQSYSEKS